MNIEPGRIGLETRVDSQSDIVTLLKDKYQIRDPKLVFVFDSNKDEPDEQQFPWKLHVFFRSETGLESARLDVPVVLKDTKIQPKGDEVIKTIYPEKWVGYCTVINGTRVWIT